MTQFKIGRLSGVGLALLLSGCSLLTPPPQPHYLTILHTNDHHGRFWQNDQGEYGMAARKTLVDLLRAQAKAEGHAVLLLSGGDINTGIPESDLQQAEPDFKGMNLLGYDAMAIGNHEFDNPLPVLRKQQSWASFPMLAANIVDEQTKQPLFNPYQIFEQAGLKIAVIGLTTTDTAKIANPDYIKGIEFAEPRQVMPGLIQRIRAEHHPDVVLAVTHMGHYHDANFGINAPGDVTLARALPAGSLDLIVGGHSQEPVCVTETGAEDKNFAPGQPCRPDQQNGVWIMQAHEWGKYVGKAVFKIDAGQKQLVSYQLIPVNLKGKDGQYVQPYIAPNPTMVEMLSPYQQQGQAQLSVPVGTVVGKLDGDRSTVRFKPSNLAHLIIKAQIAATQADFGVISGGGVRDSINEGAISYKDILRVHPFKNRIGYVDLSGQEVMDYLNVVGRYPADAGAYLQYSNVSFTIGARELADVQINGQPLDLSKQYRMSINSYNAAGGDGYPVLNSHPSFVDTSRTDAEVLKDYIQAHSPINANAY